ncbi:MAG: hypothetical protein WD076_10255, partial [Parvularculaceae bacterium]
AATGVVNPDTNFEIRQSGDIVSAAYAGGAVVKGYLVGLLQGATLEFRYCQIDAQGNLDGGRSLCALTRLGDGRIAMTERFVWESRAAAGENVFEELVVI